MNEPHLRLQDARRRAGFETASDAARAFGWNENTYRSHENGERGLRPGVVAQYARAFKSSPAWLLLGTTPTMEVDFSEKEPVLIFRNDMILTSYEDGRKLFIDTNLLYTALAKSYILIDTEDLEPKYYLGDLLIMTPASRDNWRSMTDLLVEDQNGKLMFGEILSLEQKMFLKTPGSKLFSIENATELYIVMALIKRPFYEFTPKA